MQPTGTAITLLAMVMPLLVSPLLPFLVQRLPRWAVDLPALVPAIIFLWFCQFVPEIAAGHVITAGYDWVPGLSLRFSVLIDGLSLSFALLISGIGALIVLFSRAYLGQHRHYGRFLAFLFAFMGAMLGLVLADGFLLLFIFWELTSITSFLLIGFDHRRAEARRAALQALIITGGGGLCLLAGLLLVGLITGVNAFSGLQPVAAKLAASPILMPATALILLGAFTKSAQFPFHVWLPNAMEAPTPVSAYLHSATMVKAGIYLILRLNPVFGPTSFWQLVLPVVGAVTLISATVIALSQTDLKKVLAYTTVASLGLIVLLVGIGNKAALIAAILYLLAHSLFKGALFMVVGTVDHAAGSRNVQELSGLSKRMPITFMAALLAALSMGGFPPFLGFIAKEEIYDGLIGHHPRALIFTLVALAGNSLMLAAGLIAGLKPFTGALSRKAHDAHEGQPGFWIGPVVLSLVGLMTALVWPRLHLVFTGPVLKAVSGVDTVPAVSLAPIPHFSSAFALSMATFLFGLAIYANADLVRQRLQRLVLGFGPGPDKAFDLVVRGLILRAAALTRAVHSGRLERYLTATFVALAALMMSVLYLSGEWPEWPSALALPAWQVLTMISLAVVGLVMLLAAPDRLTAIIALGIQGFAIAFLYLLFGAPDLAFTQFMVETLSVVILALVMLRLRLSPADHRRPGERFADGLIAMACGLSLTLVLMAATSGAFDRRLSDFYEHWSRLIAHGRNVVNVIIVDFRGTDTLGEIAVVLIAALSILALIRARPSKQLENKPATASDPAQVVETGEISA